MGNLWRCCAKVREPIELSFGVVSGIGSGIGVLDGGPRAPNVREGFFRILNDVFEFIFKTEMYSTLA